MHALLKRQLKQHFGATDSSFLQQYREFLEAVNEAYRECDDDRAMLKRTIELSSREVRKADAELRATFQALPDLFFHLDPLGQILDCKGGSEIDFGLAPAELLGKRIQEVAHKTARKMFSNALQQAAAAQSTVSFEYAARVDGLKNYYEVRMIPLFAGQTIAVIQNISERKRAEETQKLYAHKLARSNHELQEMFFVVSHHVREPLRKIQTFGNRLESAYGEVLDDRGRDYLQRLQNAATDMQNLINGLLAYSRVTSKSAHFVPVDLTRATSRALSNLNLDVQPEAGRVEVGALPVIEADAAQIELLLQNLISNAIKFHRPGEVPVVRVDAELVEDKHLNADAGQPLCQISVADNGIGFDEKYLDRIFGIFQRLHSRDTYDGPGVGLALCRRIAEHHGGTITAKSALGTGSTFIVRLPVSQVKGGRRLEKEHL